MQKCYLFTASFEKSWYCIIYTVAFLTPALTRIYTGVCSSTAAVHVRSIRRNSGNSYQVRLGCGMLPDCSMQEFTQNCMI